MRDVSSLARRVRRLSSCPARLLVALALLLALLPALAARAQAPSWQLALAPTQLGGVAPYTQYAVTATATDAAGNVYLTGSYSGQVQFGSTVLTSAGGSDVFVACYRPASGTWAWATSGGGTGYDYGQGIATDGTRVYVTGNFVSSTNARFAGQTLAGTGGVADAFVAAYAADTGAGAWATSGGGLNSDGGNGIATDGTRVYVTGYFIQFAGEPNVSFAGQTLTGAGSFDTFVAAYAASTGAGVWAVSGGGTGYDVGYGIATDGTRVYVTGDFVSSTSARFAGQALAGAGSFDTFVVAYAASTGAGAWVTSGGGSDTDIGYDIATDGTRVYVAGIFASNTNARIAGQPLAGTGSSTDVFVAAYAAGTGAGAWVTSGGGSDYDSIQGIATDGTRVYITGYFPSSTDARFAGQALAGAGGFDAFVAAYMAGTGAGGGAVSGGGPGDDQGIGIAVGSPGSVWVGGYVAPPATFGATTLAGSTSQLAFLGQVLIPLPVPTLASVAPTSGPVGSSVVLTGTGFGAGATVSFNGVAATGVVVNSVTSITAMVPTGATTGNVMVTTSGGTSNGVAFTVTLPLPTVETGTPANITSTAATLGGTVTAQGGASVTERGVVYVAGSGLPTTASGKVVVGSGPGSFSTTLAGLLAGTLYSVRAYALSMAGTSYGAPASFTTLGMLATVPSGGTAGLVLYPNPAGAAQVRTLELPAALRRYAATAMLSDALGRVVCTQQLPTGGGAGRTLAVAGLAPGLYVLRLHTPAGELSSKLMIE